MRSITYYRGSLALPLMSPLVGWMLIQAGLFPGFGAFLFGTILMGAIPYVLATVILIVASVKMNEEKFEYWWHFAPFIAALMFMLSLSAIFIFYYITEYSAVGDQRSFRFEDLAGGCLVGAIYCLAVGYVYVIIAKLLYWLLKALYVIRVAPRDGPFNRP